MLLLLLRCRARPQLVAALLLIAIGLLIAAAPIGARDGYSVYYSPAARAAELLFGCLGAVIWRHRLIRVPAALTARLPPERARNAQSAAPLASAARQPCSRTCSPPCSSTTSSTTEQVYLRACLLAVPLIVNLVGTPSSLLARAIACPPLRFLGRISYALYLFHLLMRNVVYHYLPHNSIYLNALLTIALSIALAAASWHVIESRALGRSRRDGEPKSTQEAKRQPWPLLEPVRDLTPGVERRRTESRGRGQARWAGDDRRALSRCVRHLASALPARQALDLA